jgi:transposase
VEAAGDGAELPSAKQAVTRETFTFRVRKEKLREAELVDGHYLLRSNQMGEEPAVLWERYIRLTQVQLTQVQLTQVQLTQVEAAFKSMKGELGIRPIFHQLQRRVEAHVFVAFLGYCLLVTLKSRLAAYAPGLTPKAVLEKLGKIQMIDV